jgi:signal peptidase I
MSTVISPAPVIRPAAEQPTAQRPAAQHAGHKARHATTKARPAYRLWRFVSGLFLVVLTVGSVTGMLTVIHDKIGFSPVLSPSMEPTFHPGDLIVTKPEFASHIKVGQIIALPVPHEKGQRYVHRIISVTMHDGKPVVQTKGDANPMPEQFKLTVTSKYVPQVVSVVPKIGRLSLLTQRSGLRLAIILVTAIFALVAVKRLVLGVRFSSEEDGAGEDS